MSTRAWSRSTNLAIYLLPTNVVVDNSSRASDARCVRCGRRRCYVRRARAVTMEVHPARVRFAVCVTGLERSYPEIRWNIRAAIFGLLASAAPQTDIHVFGVRPVNDSWPNARKDFGPLVDTIEDQRPCRPSNAPLPMWFTCTRGSKTIRGENSCTRSFQQMMCDLCAAAGLCTCASCLCLQCWQCHSTRATEPSALLVLPTGRIASR